VALASGGSSFVTGDADAGAVEAVIGVVEDAIDAIGRAEASCVDAAMVGAELAVAARLARHGAWRLLQRAGGKAPPVDELRADLAEAIEGQQAAWLARSRPGGLEDSLGRLRRTLAKYS
jgi:hexosaminidase